MKNKFKKLLLVVITVLSVLPFSKVFAKESGSIEITTTATNTSDNQAVSGVKLGIYKIAEADDTKEYGYSIASTFNELGISIEDIMNTETISTVASTCSQYVESNSLNPISVETSDSNGNLSFNGLEDGIYLIKQVNSTSDFENLGYTYSTDPYIVAIPSLDSDGNKIRHIQCQPKGILKEETKPTSLTVYKVWKDDNDKKGQRPESITVGLYNDDILKEQVKLSAGNNWMYSWDNLDNNGNWNVKELTQVSGYSTSITKSDQDWTITNTYTNVQTGITTNITGYVALGVIALCMFICLIYIKRSDKKS